MNDNGGEKICPICGYDSTKQNAEDCLPIGFTLGKRYTVGQAKHSNGVAKHSTAKAKQSSDEHRNGEALN